MSLETFLAESIQSFTNIQLKLKEDGNEVPDIQECIDFTIQLSRYQRKLQFSLPYKLFWDLSDNGPVYQMLKISLFNLKSLFSASIWNKPEMDSFCSNLVLLMLNGIEAEGFWKRPHVFISTDISQSEREALEKEIVKLGGIVAQKFTQSATHILSVGKSKYENMRGNYRIEQEINNKYQRHYCFKPDSQDQWTDEAPSKKRMKDVTEEEPLQWNLSLDWLKDGATYNEWMNEFDYMKEAEKRDADFDSFESESVQSSDESSEGYIDDDDDKNDKDGEYEFDPDDEDANEISGSDEDGSNASGAESPFVEDLDDLEDDMELIVEAKKMSAIFEWPVVIDVNLDRKIPLKLKPVEFEPIKDGVIANLSSQFDILDSPYTKSDLKPDLALPKKFESAIMMLEEIHGSVARDDFMQMYEWVLSCRNSDPHFVFNITQLRKVVPEADIHLVCDIYEFLVQEVPRTERSPIFFSKNDVLQVSDTRPTLPKMFDCVECKEDCWKLRYRALKHHYYVICSKCFETGSFLMDFGSHDFYLERGFGLDSDHYKEQQWDPETRLQLVEGLQSTTDIKLLAEKLKKPRFEVWFNAVTLPSEYSHAMPGVYKDPKDVLKVLLGDTINPISKLIQVLEASAHPGLAAEAAKVSLECLLNKDVDHLKIEEYRAIAIKAWKAVISKCTRLADNEESYIEIKAKELIDCLVKRISLKADVLSSIPSPFQDAPNQEQTNST